MELKSVLCVSSSVGTPGDGLPKDTFLFSDISWANLLLNASQSLPIPPYVLNIK